MKVSATPNYGEIMAITHEARITPRINANDQPILRFIADNPRAATYDVLSSISHKLDNFPEDFVRGRIDYYAQPGVDLVARETNVTRHEMVGDQVWYRFTLTPKGETALYKLELLQKVESTTSLGELAHLLKGAAEEARTRNIEMIFRPTESDK